MSDLTDYYANLLIIQYNGKPKASASIDSMAKSLLASEVSFDVRDGYDIDTAVGVQLDVLGKYADIDRFYYSYEFTDDYFGFADANNMGGVSANIIGFDDANAPDKAGAFLSSDDVISNNLVLSDDVYRQLIKLRIIQNNSTHDNKSISDALFEFFGTNIIMNDNQDMTITYLVGDASNPLVQVALQKEVFPKPIGVGMQVIGGTEFFGFGDASNLTGVSDYVVGFNDATSGLIKDGGFLNANSDIL